MGSLQMPQVVLLDPFSDASAAVAVAAEALASESGPCSMSIWSGMTPPEQACRRGTIEAMILIVIFISSFGSDRSLRYSALASASSFLYLALSVAAKASVVDVVVLGGSSSRDCPVALFFWPMVWRIMMRRRTAKSVASDRTVPTVLALPMLGRTCLVKDPESKKCRGAGT